MGNLESLRDWGHAKDYAEMQWKILQHKKPDDFVIATDFQCSVRKFVEKTAKEMGFTIKWKGKGLKEKGIVNKINKKLSKYCKIKEGNEIISVNKRYFRPLDVKNLLGDSTKARRELKWKPKYSLDQLVKEMVNNDFNEAYNQFRLKNINEKKTSKIYVAGHRGLVGSAIVNLLKKKGFSKIILRTRSQLDLTKQTKVNNFFKKHKPEIVIIAAAKVGGIYANNKYQANFIYENLMIQNNLINSSFENKVKKVIFLGSSCIYPKHSKQPIKEDYLLSGELEKKLIFHMR